MYKFKSHFELLKECVDLNQRIKNSDASFKTLQLAYIEIKKQVEVLGQEKEDLERQLAQLETSKIQSSRIHNERNAGRKRMATDDVAKHMLLLREQGMSYGKIAKIISAETETKWNKATVYNTINRLKINKQTNIELS